MFLWSASFRARLKSTCGQDFQQVHFKLTMPTSLASTDWSASAFSPPFFLRAADEGLPRKQIVYSYRFVRANKCEKFDENFLKYWGLSGAKACKSCRSRQELSNECFVAKFSERTERTCLLACFDIADKILPSENESSKVCQKVIRQIDIELGKS